MKSLEELLQIKNELIEFPVEDSIDLEFVIELVESHIEALNK
jgi:hypothetical protein